MAKGIRVAALCAALTVFAGTAAVVQAAPTPDSPDDLLDSIKNGPYARIGPWLGNLYEEYHEASGKGVTDKAFKTGNPLLRVSNGAVGIDAYATDAAALVI